MTNCQGTAAIRQFTIHWLSELESDVSKSEAVYNSQSQSKLGFHCAAEFVSVTFTALPRKDNLGLNYYNLMSPYFYVAFVGSHEFQTPNHLNMLLFALIKLPLSLNKHHPSWEIAYTCAHAPTLLCVCVCVYIYIHAPMIQ